jgi:menaquinone-dependent protoporphyrinogen oxidase
VTTKPPYFLDLVLVQNITDKGVFMPANILVTFATKAGSTQEIAEAIAARLREKGLKADIRTMKEVRDISAFSAIVMGAPMYMFHFLKDAPQFLSRFQKTLVDKPTAFFSLGPFNDVEKDWAGVKDNFEKEMAKFPWFKPVATAVFGGKFDPTKLTFPFNVLPGLKQLPASDLRDWTKIQEWADELAKIFKA